MGFKGYKLQFELYASHLSSPGDLSTVHRHTFRISLFLRDMNETMDLYRDVEQVVNDRLAILSNRNLDELDMFHSDTTVEGIGRVLFDMLSDTVREISFQLVRLEIGDSPIRCFCVTKSLMDDSVNGIARMPYLKIEDEQQIEEDLIPAEQESGVSDAIAGIAESDAGEITQEEQQDIEAKQKDSETEEPVTNTKEDFFTPLFSCVDKKKSEKTKLFWQVILSLVIIVAAAAGIVFLIAQSGVYPRGSDTFNHMFRGKMVYEGILEHNYYLLYTPKWYNGVEIMRYWSPIPLYLIAGCIALAGGDLLNGYLVLIGALIIIGAIGWLLIGLRQKRVLLGALIGVLWFLLPDNMRILFNEGNIPRIVAGVLLPYLFYCIYEYTQKERRGFIYPAAALTAAIALCHLMIAAMVGITVFIYLMIHAIVSKKIVPQLFMLMGMVISFAVIGVWLYGALNGGLMEMSSQGTAQVMKDFFADGFTSLNPVLRFQKDQAVFYFGLAMFIVAVLGCLFGTKETLPGFTTVLFLYFSTTYSMYEVYSRLPLHQFFWMIRFIPVGLAAAMLSFLLWKGLKKWVVALLCILLIADASSSLCYLYVPKDGRIDNVLSNQYERALQYGILQAKDLTTQRMTIYDESSYGAFAAYMVSGTAPERDYSFGWAWQGAKTARNLVALNDACAEGFYLYLFDRSLELGDDCILIKKSLLSLEQRPSAREELISAADSVGYDLAEEGEEFLIFRLRSELDSFGLVSEYRGLAIGSSACDTAKLYPVMEEAENDNLDDYEAEDFKDYEMVYLSGFEYSDRDHLDKLLKELNAQGIRVVINMNHIPDTNLVTGNDILGVSAHAVTFEGAYPELKYKDVSYISSGFDAENSLWSTVYLNGCEDVIGYGELGDKQLVFAGKKNAYPNITFLGYNMVYHVLISKDEQEGMILDDVFGFGRDELPKQYLVSLSVTHSPYQILIESPEDNVNTTLACYDVFASDRAFRSQNNLLYVDKGETRIEIKPPYLKEGLLLSGVGIIGFAVFAVLSTRVMKRRRVK